MYFPSLTEYFVTRLNFSIIRETSGDKIDQTNAANFRPSWQAGMDGFPAAWHETKRATDSAQIYFVVFECFL